MASANARVVEGTANGEEKFQAFTAAIAPSAKIFNTEVHRGLTEEHRVRLFRRILTG
jgi:hypothetical protein